MHNYNPEMIRDPDWHPGLDFFLMVGKFLQTETLPPLRNLTLSYTINHTRIHPKHRVYWVWERGQNRTALRGCMSIYRGAKVGVLYGARRDCLQLLLMTEQDETIIHGRSNDAAERL